MTACSKQIERYIWSYNASDASARYSFWRHFLQIVVMVGRDLVLGMITLRAMSLVYTTILSMVPLMAVSISVLKGFGIRGQLEPVLTNLLEPLGAQSAELSARIVGFVENMQIGVLGALGIGLLIYTSISLILKIETSFNHIWHLHSSRSLMQRFSDYLSVILVGPVLVFSAVGITASLASHRIVGAVQDLPYMTDLLYLFGKVAAVFAGYWRLYLYLPAGA